MTDHRVKSLLLAAGLGTRLRPITERIPKCLVPIAGRFLLDHWVDALHAASVRDARINTHHLPQFVQAYLNRINRSGELTLTQTHEPNLLGSAGTVTANRDLADDADQIIIIYADNLSNVNLAEMLRFHNQHDDPFTMLLFHAPDPAACGIATLDDHDRIVDFIEKPDRPSSDLANAGVYIVDADAYRQVADAGAFDFGFEVLPQFVGRMRGFVWNGYHLDIGSHENLTRANADAPAHFTHRRTFSAAGLRPAVFLDRDGTINVDVSYLSDPAEMKLIDGAADAICRLREAGFACVVITNQSVVGRGRITEDQLTEIHQAMHRQLADHGAALDGLYYCTTVPTTTDRTVIEDIDRKPGPGMIWRAAIELGLDLTQSWMVGDMISDVLVGHNAHCRGSIHVATGQSTTTDELPADVSFRTVPDIGAAADFILSAAVATT